MPSALRPVLLVVLTAAVYLAGATPAAATSCSVKGKESALGATYVTQLSATGTRCASAEKVVKAFHSCRRKAGKAGFCRTSVRGYRCAEKRSNVIATQYDSRTTCRRGGARVVLRYTQFT